MGTGQLFAGNLANLIIAILAFLEVIPWPIAGYLIIGSIIISTLSWSASRNHSSSATQSSSETSPLSASQPTVSSRQAASVETIQRKTGISQLTPTLIAPVAVVSSVEIEKHSEPKPADGFTKIGEGDFLSFDLTMKKGEEAFGEVSSSGLVNLYIMDDENATALDSDQEFWYEAGLEGVQGGSVRFVAPEDGEWFLIVENAETKEIDAKAKVSVTMPSHPVSLKTESLELPDARLEGRL